ncbi:MAG: hypothetical protein VX663_08105 [Pseudomonadota bacterium]|nr:hypothetical protein [Pseudomonadota bacterium]
MSANIRRKVAIATAIALVMVATRGYHVGSEFNLGDASLAAFFLGGLYLGGAGWFLALIGVAAATDWLAIAGGVSAWCVTPAYPFLALGYGALWLCGRAAAPLQEVALSQLVRVTGYLLAGSLAAFVISNLSFFLLSDYFTGMSLATYAARVVQYFWPYVGYALLYTAVGLMVHGIVVALRGQSAASPTRGV